MFVFTLHGLPGNVVIILLTREEEVIVFNNDHCDVATTGSKKVGQWNAQHLSVFISLVLSACIKFCATYRFF